MTIVYPPVNEHRCGFNPPCLRFPNGKTDVFPHQEQITQGLEVSINVATPMEMDGVFHGKNPLEILWSNG